MSWVPLSFSFEDDSFTKKSKQYLKTWKNYLLTDLSSLPLYRRLNRSLKYQQTEGSRQHLRFGSPKVMVHPPLPSFFVESNVRFISTPLMIKISYLKKLSWFVGIWRTIIWYWNNWTALDDIYQMVPFLSSNSWKPRSSEPFLNGCILNLTMGKSYIETPPPPTKDQSNLGLCKPQMLPRQEYFFCMRMLMQSDAVNET